MAAAKPLKEESFVLDGGRLSISSPYVFNNDPLNLMRLFCLASERDLGIHPYALTAARLSLFMITL